jgi:3-methyl-2-oxobutanoate hydroxymethyltransferase
MRVTIRNLQEMKDRGEKIAMLTAYDYPMSRLLDEAGIPIILVGDSVGDNVLGYQNTVPVTMDDMVHHLRAVVRGTKRTHIVCDMPFMSYQADTTEAMRNAGRLLKEGAQSVKPEGGRRIADTIRPMVEAGIPVMGHIGLTPQSVNQLSGYRVQGRDPENAKSLIEDAHVLQDAGVYALVLETVPAELAREITEKISIPTIGIGAGVHCDGQVLVSHDVYGIGTGRKKKHVRKYASLAEIVTNATQEYMADVQSGNFPGDEESFSTVRQVVEEATARSGE